MTELEYHELVREERPSYMVAYDHSVSYNNINLINDMAMACFLAEDVTSALAIETIRLLRDLNIEAVLTFD